MPFSQRTLEFLLENRLMDSRVWFAEHKDEYQEYVLEPMCALVEALTPALLSIDPQFICIPKAGKSISRIYRDTRFSKSKSIYRENVWCVFMRDKKLYDGMPGYYFEVNPGGYEYGCGYYKAGSESMQAIRDLILAGDKSAESALKAYKKQKVFELYDERYKRSRHPNQPAEKRNWLDQRSINLSCSGSNLELLFSNALAEKLAADFKLLTPVYKFLMKAESAKPHEKNR